MKPGLVRLGTSAFTAAGWTGSFYPAKLKPAEYLTFYATQFDSVEIDSTFYHTPPASTVRPNWIDSWSKARSHRLSLRMAGNRNEDAIRFENNV